MKNLSLKLLLLKIKFSYKFKPRSHDIYTNSPRTLLYLFLIGLSLAISISVWIFPSEYTEYLGPVFSPFLSVALFCFSFFLFCTTGSSKTHSFLSLIHFLTQPFFAFEAKNIEKNFEKLHFIFTKECQEDTLEYVYYLSQTPYFESSYDLTQHSNFYQILYKHLYPVKTSSRKGVKSYAELKSSIPHIEQEEQEITFFEQNESQNSKQTAFHK